MDDWPKHFEGEIYPAFGVSLDQWEIGHFDKMKIDALPLSLYKETWRTGHGAPIRCQYNDEFVTASFNRQLKPKRMWIGTNRRNGGSSATDEWYDFLLSGFGIMKGNSHKTIPVHVYFYSNHRIVIQNR